MAKGLTVDVKSQGHDTRFEGWGTSLAWFAHVLGGAPEAVRSEYADRIFDVKSGLGLNIVRYNIGGGENPQYSSMEPRARIPGYQPEPGRYDWLADANQRWMLQAAMERGADIAEAFCNSPPYWMTVSRSVTGSHGGLEDNLHVDYYNAYSDYLLTVARHFRDHWGVAFDSLDPLNEPLSNWWTFGGRQEGCRFGLAAQNRILKTVGRALRESDLTTILAASDENSIDETVETFTSYDDEARSLIGRVNTHSYNGSAVGQLAESVRAAGKALWMSEYGDGDATGLTMSQRILIDMKVLKPTAWVYWQAVDDVSGPGWGMLSSDLNHPSDFSCTVNRKYYVMQNYSRFIRPGFCLIDVEDDEMLAAYDKNTDTLVLVITNLGDLPEVYTVNLADNRQITGQVQPYRTSTTETCLALPKVPFQANQFSFECKAKSVSTLVIQLTSSY